MALTKIKRPRTFSEVRGQERAVSLLRASLAKGNVPFVSIFTGPFGTGKTTLARIVAKSLNCENRNEDGSPCCECESCKAIDTDNSMDVLELDAASNNGVADVLKLVEGIKYAPVKGKYKVYIIDEVHRLSPQAFDTLLKTFEEPPEYVRFILCTTEAHKVPATITSRGTKFSLEKISLQVIEDQLKDICREYSCSYEEDAIKLLAKDSDGHMRDALKNLEDMMKMGEVKTELVISLLGIGENATLFETIKSISEGKIEQALALVDSILNKGCNLNKLVKQYIVTLTDLLLFKRTNSTELIYNTESYKNDIKGVDLPYETISDMLAKFNSIYEGVSKGGDEFTLKTGLIQLVAEESIISSLTKRLTSCEEKIGVLENALSCKGAEVIPMPINNKWQVEIPTVVEEVAAPSLPTVEPSTENSNLVETSIEPTENTVSSLTDGFEPVEDMIPFMDEIPFNTDSLPGDINTDFDIGEAIALFDEPASVSNVSVDNNSQIATADTVVTEEPKNVAEPTVVETIVEEPIALEEPVTLEQLTVKEEVKESVSENKSDEIVVAEQPIDDWFSELAKL